jgi:peptidoglycan/xylan/chitin deacetylase (PgdA/CDA1 family)
VNVLAIVVSFFISLFLYPETYVCFGRWVQDASAQQRLSAFSPAINNATKNDIKKTKVIFLFDDGWKSVYTQAYPVFNDFQFPGNVAIIPGLTGEGEYLNLNEIAQMYMNDWNILNHTFSHKENMYDDSKGLLIDFNKARDWMNEKYLSKCSGMAVIPYGEANPYLIKLLRDAKYQNIRTADNVIIMDTDKTCYFPERSISLLTDVQPREIKEVLEETQNQGNTIIFILHKIGEQRDNYKMTFSAKKLREILQFIKDQPDKFQVVTYSSLFS